MTLITQAEKLLRKDRVLIEECYNDFQAEASTFHKFTAQQAKSFTDWMKTNESAILGQSTK
jgi:hypothetical protein